MRLISNLVPLAHISMVPDTSPTTWCIFSQKTFHGGSQHDGKVLRDRTYVQLHYIKVTPFAQARANLNLNLNVLSPPQWSQLAHHVFAPNVKTSVSVPYYAGRRSFLNPPGPFPPCCPRSRRLEVILKIPRAPSPRLYTFKVYGG